MSLADKIQVMKANRLFRAFQWRDAKAGEIIEVGGLEKPAVALAVGTAISIGYKAIGDGKDYYHEFEGNRPKVFVSADGKQVYFLGGEYTFTGRGFIR